jgi:hypothetical protein
MRRFIFSLLLALYGTFAAFAQKNPTVVPPSLHTPFYEFRNQREGDSTTRENARAALESLRKRCDAQLVDSDIMIITHGDSVDLKRAEDALKKDDADIKPIEEEIKRLIRNSKDPVVFRAPNGLLIMRVERYFIQDDRVYFRITYEDVSDPNTCH